MYYLGLIIKYHRRKGGGLMGFSKWLMKKGAIGGATRLMIKAYRREKESNPNTSDREIFKTITKWRYSTTGKHLDYLTLGTAKRSESLRKYLKCIVVYERLPDSIGSEDIIREVIDEICDEENID
jgi:hypothetical protein